MVPLFSLSDVRRGYRFLGHQDHGVTEVAVVHPSYRRDDPAWNRRQHAWPLTFYVFSEQELLRIVRRYAGERMVCYGLNPRPSVLRREDGRLRAGKEEDVAESMTLLLDVDLEGAVSASRLASLTRFLKTADTYFRSLGVARPFRASTGRGSHLLFPYAPIVVAAVPDVRERLRTFREGFVAAVRADLSRLEAKVDSTQDLRRVTRVYGTSKPAIGVVSRFYGRERLEDPALRTYLLGLQVPAPVPGVVVPVTAGTVLPAWFEGLLSVDARLRSLWDGRGKPAGSDCSMSGYDFSVVRYLVRQGYRNPRPDGHFAVSRLGFCANLQLAVHSLAGTFLSGGSRRMDGVSSVLGPVVAGLARTCSHLGPIGWACAAGVRVLRHRCGR